jgi:two-component system sensor histidine kinase KdpD
MTGLLALLPALAHIANASMLYLLVVIGVALGWGSSAAVLASVMGFFAFDFFFVEPRFTFTVRDPAEWVSLLMFLVTAVVTGHLTALLRARAQEAGQRERQTAALAEASWTVARQVDREQALREVLGRVRDVVQPRQAAIFVQPSAISDQPSAGAEILAWWSEAAPASPELEHEAVTGAVAFVLAQGRPINWGDDRQHWQKALGAGRGREETFLPLALEDRVIGVLYLAWAAPRRMTEEERRVVESLANHAAVIVERGRLAHAEAGARALAEADRLKTALLSMVSHDFRSPLTSIKASVTALLQQGAQPDAQTQRELLEGIESETDRLNGLVGNILALSRLESDSWRPQMEPISLVEVIGSAAASLSAEQQARLLIDLDDAPPEICLDSVQMAQVMRNLLENALKYSDASAPVEVRVRRAEGDLVIEVFDRGPGLADGEMEQVFKPFYRGPAFQESAVPGLGLGLAVCRGLVEAHGGRLTARNRDGVGPPTGGGAVFSVALPLDRAAQGSELRAQGPRSEALSSEP